jgi:perosamine synthetase
MLNVQAVVSAAREAVGAALSPVLLHGPELGGNEWRYVKECIDTGWVSSAGSYVTEFERRLAELTGAKHAVAVVNGTAALHVALMLAGVERDDEVLMPSLTFVATANAAAYCGAVPHFCDVDYRTLGMDVGKLEGYLEEVGEVRDPDRRSAARTSGPACFNRLTGRQISAIVPMHTFGHPVEMDGLMALAEKWGLPVVEDAAESLGSYFRGRHTGVFGRMGILSFNGNKIVTTGAGGAIVTDDEALAKRAKHLTTTAKTAHPWEYVHDEVGYNYRMPNINAAMGCAQLEQLPGFLERKRRLAGRYAEAFSGVEGVQVFREPERARSNHWLNALMLEKGDDGARDAVLSALNDEGLQSRPIWRPMHQLPMYERCPRMDLRVTEDLSRRIVNVPSSAGLIEASMKPATERS